MLKLKTDDKRKKNKKKLRRKERQTEMKPLDFTILSLRFQHMNFVFFLFLVSSAFAVFLLFVCIFLLYLFGILWYFCLSYINEYNMTQNEREQLEFYHQLTELITHIHTTT